MNNLVNENIWWSTVAIIPSRAINYITIIILARILTPEIFGEYSYAIIIFQYFALLANPGLQSAFIYLKKPPEEMAGTFLFLNIFIGVFLFLIINLTSPLFALFFKSDSLPQLMRFISLSFLFNCSAYLHGAWLSKTLEFKKKFYPILFSTLISCSISIFMALSGYGIWSLVAKHICESFVAALLYMLVSKKKFVLKFDKAIAAAMFKYGLPLHLIIILSFIRLNIDYLFVGKLLGTESLGLYRQAYNTVSLPIYNLSIIVSGIAFPAFAKIIDQETIFKKQFNNIFKIQLALVSVICFIFILIPDSLTLVFFGEKWKEMIPIIRILAFFFLLRMIVSPFFECYKAKGLLRIRIIISIVSIGILLPALYLGARFGIKGVALSHLLAFVPFLILEFFLLAFYFDVNWKEVFLGAKKVISYLLAIFVFLFLVKSVVPTSMTYYHQVLILLFAGFSGVYYLLLLRKLKISKD